VVLIVAGTHIPEIPFVDVVRSVGGVLFRQIDSIVAKFGVVLAFVVITRVVVVAH